MSFRPALRSFAAVALCGALLLAPAPRAYAAAADVRILVDVSGSMKQNDPANLRVPALQLIAGLLPAGTEAGIWMFAQKSEILLKSSKVDDAWRAQARKALPKIHSRGLFTHIEDVLNAAMTGWTDEAGHPARHIVLLTDGVVDVSKDSAASAASRQRILGEQIERLKALGAQVHAVALSDNVDKDLMSELTSKTGGWLEQASDAEKLQRIFLHMLEQAAPPVTVPLNGNHFDIDDSVSELTLLVFRKGDQALTVTPPGGAALTVTKHPENVQWKSEAGYDLVTVAAPIAGAWEFDGAVDPDNRAVIVTDLALELAPFPSTLLASESVAVSAMLTAEGSPMKRLELLELIKAGTVLGTPDQPADAVTGSLALNRDTAVFEGMIASHGLDAGIYDLAVTLDGGTFKRQINKRIRFAADPLTFSYTQETGEVGAVMLEATPDAELAKAESLTGYIVVTDADDLVRAVPLPPVEAGVIRLRIPASMAGAHVFAPQFFLETRDNRLLKLAPPPQTFELTFPPAPATEEPPAVPEVPAAAPFSWLTLSAVIGIGNVVLALGLGLVWWLIGRKQATLVAAGAPA